MIYHIARLIFSIIVLYHAVAVMTWQVRNPKANEMTLYTRYSDVMHWRKLPEFQ